MCAPLPYSDTGVFLSLCVYSPPPQPLPCCSNTSCGRRALPHTSPEIQSGPLSVCVSLYSARRDSAARKDTNHLRTSSSTLDTHSTHIATASEPLIPPAPKASSLRTRPRFAHAMTFGALVASWDAKKLLGPPAPALRVTVSHEVRAGVVVLRQAFRSRYVQASTHTNLRD